MDFNIIEDGLFDCSNSLSRLSLCKAFTRDIAESISVNSNLESLNMSHCVLDTVDLLNFFESLVHIKILDLGYTLSLTDECILLISKTCVYLETLVLKGCVNLSDDSIIKLVGIKSLINLNCDFLAISALTATELLRHDFHSLSFHSCSLLHNCWIVHFAKECNLIKVRFNRAQILFIQARMRLYDFY